MEKKICDESACKPFWKNVIYVLIILGPAMYFGVKDQTVAMGLAIAGGALAIAFINIDKFSWIKAAGFEAKIWEAQETINAAYATAEELRQVSCLFLDYSLSALIVDGLGQEITANQKIDMSNSINKLIGKVGTEEQSSLPEKYYKLKVVIGWNLLDEFLALLQHNNNDVYSEMRSKRDDQFKPEELTPEKYLKKEELDTMLKVKNVELTAEEKKALDKYIEYITILK